MSDTPDLATQVAAQAERRRRHRHGTLVAQARRRARALPGTDTTTELERPGLILAAIRAWRAGRSTLADPAAPPEEPAP